MLVLQSGPPGQAQNQRHLRVSTASRKCLQMMEVALDWVFLAVLGDDGLELGLIPKLHGVRLVRLIVVVDVPLGGARVSLAGLLADVEVVENLHFSAVLAQQP